MSPSFLSLFHCFFFSIWVFLSLVFVKPCGVVIGVVEKKMRKCFRPKVTKTVQIGCLEEFLNCDQTRPRI